MLGVIQRCMDRPAAACERFKVTPENVDLAIEELRKGFI